MIKRAESTKEPKMTLSNAPKLGEHSRKVLRRMAKVMFDIGDGEPLPAHYRLSVDLYSQEAEDVYNHAWHSLQKKKIERKYEWSNDNGKPSE